DGRTGRAAVRVRTVAGGSPLAHRAARRRERRAHRARGRARGAVRARARADPVAPPAAQGGLGRREPRAGPDAHRGHARREAAQEARPGGGFADPDGARRGISVHVMRRIRIALALVSLAALALVALLAWRANQGLAAERAVRHQAVAERAFEEMERALSEFLAREEARPFDQYAYTSPVSGERSPLASGLEPFVVGAFQLDPEGVLTTPLDPNAAAVARVRTVVSGLWAKKDADI